jgi:hypothetical protein
VVYKYEKAGLIKANIEDLGEEDDLFSFKTEAWEKFFKGRFDKIPKPIQNISKGLAMTHDTKMYQLMKELTQMSDLTSRIVVSEFKQSKGMTEGDALNLVDSTFINYDIPSHENVQFADDMGLFMFNKFFFRIQAVLARQVGTHPARFLTLLGVEQVFGTQEAIHHSLITPEYFTAKFNNPLKLPFTLWTTNFYNWLFSFHAPVYQPE